MAPYELDKCYMLTQKMQGSLIYGSFNLSLSSPKHIWQHVNCNNLDAIVLHQLAQQ